VASSVTEGFLKQTFVKRVRQRAKEIDMKAITWAALAVVGASFAVAPAVATPLNPGAMSIAPDELSNVIQVDQKWNGNKHWKGNRKWKRRHGNHNNWGNNNRWRHHHNDNDFVFGFGFGLPLLGYGLGAYNDGPECYGRWHRHNNGRLHCHGRLVY